MVVYCLDLFCVLCVFFFFFFQAEDGIRDVAVTGVQTCALPISLAAASAGFLVLAPLPFAVDLLAAGRPAWRFGLQLPFSVLQCLLGASVGLRSEERRVGKSVDLGGRRIIKKKKCARR